MSSAKVIGIDPSLTGFAICVMDASKDYETKRWTTHFLGNRVDARMDRVLPLIECVMEVVDEAKPKVIAIEGYSYGSNDRGNVERIEMGGILRADLHTLADCEVFEVAPMTLKKFCTGKGKGNKVAMIVAMTKRWGVEFGDDDRYDAYGLARMALCLAGLSKPGTAPQRESVESVLRGPRKKKRRQSNG